MPVQSAAILLKNTCRKTGASWAAWMRERASTWRIHAACKLDRTARARLLDYVSKPSGRAWLARAISRGTISSLKPPVRLHSRELKLFVVPGRRADEILLVGAARLDVSARQAWSELTHLDAETPEQAARMGGGEPGDPRAGLETALGTMVESIRCQGAWIAIRDGDHLVVRAAFQQPRAIGMHLPLESETARQEPFHGIPVLLAERGKPGWDRVPSGALPSAARAWAAVPLISGDRLLGQAALWRAERFEVAEAARMATLAGELTPRVEAALMVSELAAENLRLKEAAESGARALDLIHELARRALGHDNFREMAQAAVDLLVVVPRYTRVAVLLTDPAGVLRVLTMGGGPGGMLQGLADLATTVEEGPALQAFESGRTVLVTDSRAEGLGAAIPGWGDGASICVPLRTAGRALGVVAVGNERPGVFGPRDLQLLESLAAMLGVLVSSADQYEQVQDVAIQLEETQQELQARIGAQKDAEARLVQAAKLAAVGEMAAGVAHELNNPLTTVVGFTELVIDELPDNSPQKSDLDLVLREARRARTVVRRLLDFSRQSETVRARTDFNEIVTDVLALMRNLLHTSGVEVIVNLEKDLPWIVVDRNQMKQVILNLLHNALNAMPKGGGQIFITSRSQVRYGDHWLTVSVRDTGTGIAPEHINRIFEPFFTTRIGQGGTGLGLSVTYGIITDHRGLIEVESQLNMGSTFTIWLPVEA